MNGPLKNLVIVLTILGWVGSVHAQGKDVKTLTYKVALGGMNAGTFASMAIPTHSVTLAGNDVMVMAKTNAPDPRPIMLTGGEVASFLQKMLTPKLGEQMTVEVHVVPVGVAPGKRCSFTLDHAYLQGVTGAELILKPSSLPKVKCTGEPPSPK